MTCASRILWVALILCLRGFALGQSVLDPPPTGPFCGINSLYTALQIEGIDVKFSSLVRAQYVGSASGSTIPELLDAAHDQHAYAQVLTNLSVSDLRNLPSPAILHVKNSYDASDFNHYILCVPVSGRLAIYDPPAEVVHDSGHELAALWDGTAVVLSSRPIRLNAMQWWAAIRSGGIALVIFGAIAVALLLSRVYRWRLDAITPRFRLLAECAITVSVTILIATTYHLTASEGLFAQRDAVAAIMAAHFAKPAASVDISQANRLWSQGAVFIDARHADDYNRDHIPGAMSIPPESSGADIDAQLRGHLSADDLVVYCQGPSCPLAAGLATRLKRHGFTNIRVLTGGWSQWHTEAEKTTQVSNLPLMEPNP